LCESVRATHHPEEHGRMEVEGHIMMAEADVEVAPEAYL
jgi:hypothetical protein